MSRRHRVNTTPDYLKRQPITAQYALDMRDKARDRWNAWASKNKEARMRYEQKFMSIDRRLDAYEKRLALENLILHEERTVFNAAAELWFELWKWEDICGALKADTLIVDPTLNDEPYWWKVTSGRSDKIHHEHEPVRGKTFLPNYPPMKSESTPLGGFKVTDTRERD